MELKDTVNSMLSDDYKERFVAEYWQTRIRYERLHKFIMSIVNAKENGQEEPKHDCSVGTLACQAYYMSMYIDTLEKRAAVENIDLSR